MGLFSNPEVIVLKETSDSKEYLTKLQDLKDKSTGNASCH